VANAHCSINAFILACVAAFAVAGAKACDHGARVVGQTLVAPAAVERATVVAASPGVRSSVERQRRAR
jgi:hypothetical protein